MDLLTLIFLAIAVAIFLRLRSVFGQRTGHERRRDDATLQARPLPLLENRAAKKSTPADWLKPAKAENAESAKPEPVSIADRLKGIAPDTPLAAALKLISSADPKFDVPSFLRGAKTAYEMILTAFAEGDRPTLRKLVSSEVLDNFEHEIAMREKAGEKIDSHFVGIDKAELTQAALKNQTAQITVRFISKLVQAKRNRAGEVIEGDPSKVSEVTDVWTFERDVGSSNPNWRLVATEGQ